MPTKGFREFFQLLEKTEENRKELRLDVYFDNISAIKAYEKIGFAKHMIEMRMSLED